MIEVKNLKKSFGKRKVLNGVSIELKQGAITGLAGPNACGKTTLIKCILGLVVPDSGLIKIEGTPIDQNGEFRRKVGYMPQNPSFPSNLSLKELGSMLEDLRHEKAVHKKELITHFELERIASQPFYELSGGTKQKIAIVLAFMFDASVFICDEPTAGLDPFSSVSFKDFLTAQARKGKTIVFVSHQLTEIQQLASEVMFMNNGNMLYSGKADELRSSTGTVDLEHAIIQFFSHQRENNE